MQLKTLVLATAIATAAALNFVGTAMAQPFNEPPPGGNQILNLNGGPILGNDHVDPATYTQYSASFTASQASTIVSFTFRDDPAFISFSDPSLVDSLAPSVNLLANPTFAGPTGTSSPTGWTSVNPYFATFAGVVAGNCGFNSGENCWYDGAVQAYDGLSQTIATTIGDTYDLTFYEAENNCLGGSANQGGTCYSTYSELSTNGDITDVGGNGIDMVVYAGNAVTGAPEPASMALLGAGLVGLGALRRRRRG